MEDTIWNKLHIQSRGNTSSFAEIAGDGTIVSAALGLQTAHSLL